MKFVPFYKREKQNIVYSYKNNNTQMAKYTKKRKYNNYSKKNYIIYKNPSLKSRAWKSIKEANNVNTALDFAFKINYAFTARYDPLTKVGVAAINCYDVLLKSENFKNMMKNYDQVKINGVTVRINITDGTTTFSTASGAQAINVITGWDKTGLSVVPLAAPTELDPDPYLGDVLFFETTTPTAVNVDNAIMGSNYDNANTPAKAFVNTIGSRITEGYGAKKGLLNNYQRFSRYEDVWPSTMDEKCCYIPTSNFAKYSSITNATNSLSIINNDYSDMDVNSQISIQNPCIPFENPGIKWKPTLLVGVFRTTVDSTTGVVTQYGECPTIVFNAEFSIPVTFKGQKGDS